MPPGPSAVSQPVDPFVYYHRCRYVYYEHKTQRRRARFRRAVRRASRMEAKPAAVCPARLANRHALSNYCCAQKGNLGNAQQSKGPLLAVLVRGLGNDMIHRCCQVAGAYNRARRARVVAPLRVCRASQREASSKKRRLNQ